MEVNLKIIHSTFFFLYISIIFKFNRGLTMSTEYYDDILGNRIICTPLFFHFFDTCYGDEDISKRDISNKILSHHNNDKKSRRK